MIRLEHSAGIGKASSRSRLMAAVAAVCLSLAALPALADSQPSSTFTSARTAYDHAVAVGTPSALHNFLLAYPNSQYASKALELLIQHCTILHPQASQQESSDSSCDLQALIAPAAGPSNNNQDDDPPTEHSFRDNASNS